MIHVCLCADERYAAPMAVTIASVLANASQNDDYAFHIIESGFTQEIKEKFYLLKRIKDCDIDFYSVETKNFEKYRLISEHITHAAYYRLILPTVLQNIDKALYLDSDVIAVTDIKELFDLNTINCFVIAKKDFLSRGSVLRLNLPPLRSYFNSGVMLLNLKEIRAENIENTLLEYAEHPPYQERFEDQDVLNYAFQAKVKLLPAKWNFAVTTDKGQYNIIHFLGAEKPWKSDTVKLQEHFWRYARLTPFYKELQDGLREEKTRSAAREGRAPEKSA